MKVGLVGYGKMGAGIFSLLANTPHEVVVLCLDDNEARSAAAKFVKRQERAFNRGGMSQRALQTSLDTHRFTWQPEELAGCRVVLEAVFEDVEIKVNLLQQLENILDHDTAILTNTSSISIATLAEGMRHPERFCGLHFFYPVQLINLAEILLGPATAPDLIERLKNFCRELNKFPIVAKDAPGSVINAILAYHYVEALYILEEGLALPSRVDSLAKSFFYLGPCEAMDVIGLDFFIGALERAATPGSILPIPWNQDFGRELSPEATGGREGFWVPALFQRLLAQGRLGKKAGQGIYIYDRDKALDDAPEFYANHSPGSLPQAPVRQAGDVLLAKRLLYAIHNGSIHSLQKGLATLEDIDRAIKEVLLMKDGPFQIMKTAGMAAVQADFEELSRLVGRRFKINNLNFLAGY